jgi:hypothetical protein
MNPQNGQFNDIAPDILEAALARIAAGEPIAAILADHQPYTDALTPLLKTAQLLQQATTEPLPAELSEWLPQGRTLFANATQQFQSAEQILPTTEDLLDQATQRLVAGEPLTDILAEHPEQIAVLAPLLRVVNQLQAAAGEPLPPELNSWLPKGRRHYADSTAMILASFGRSLRGILRRTFTWQRLASAMLVLVLFFSVAIDQASAQSMPGELLYSWKRTREDLSITLTPTHTGRSTLHLTYMHRRLQEIDTLLTTDHATDTPLLDQTAANLLIQARRATDEASQADDDGLRTIIALQVAQASAQLSSAAGSLPAINSNLEQVSSALGEMKAIQTATALPLLQQKVSPTQTQTPTATIILFSEPKQPIPTVGENRLGTTTITVSPVLPTTTPTRRLIARPTTAAQAIDPPTPTSPPTATNFLPTATPSTVSIAVTATRPPTSTPIPTSILISTNTPIPTATPLGTAERPTDLPPPSPFPTQRPPRPTATGTITPTPTSTPTPTATDTLTPTSAPTATETLTPTSAPTATDTLTPTATDTLTPTSAPTATDTPTPTSTPTATEIPTNISTVDAATPTQALP